MGGLIHAGAVKLDEQLPLSIGGPLGIGQLRRAVRIRNSEFGIRNLDGGTDEDAEAANAPVGEGLASLTSPAPNISEIPDDPAPPDASDSSDAPAPPEPDPEDAAEDTFVALLPGEEPLIIDTDEQATDTDDVPTN